MGIVLRLLMSIALICLISSCSNRKKVLQTEAQDVLQELVNETEKIETIEDLLAIKGRLGQLFNELVDIIITIRIYDVEYGICDNNTDNLVLSNQLYQEFNRILQIPGAQPAIEAIQRPALEKLDAFEKKQKAKLKKIPN